MSATKVIDTSALNYFWDEFKSQLTYYGTCSTQAAIAAKTVTLTNGTGWELTTGAVVRVKFTNTNTADNPTLSVAGTTATSISYNGSVITTSEKDKAGAADLIITYVYDGTNYIWCGWSQDEGEVNQNAFSNVAVGSSTIAADSTTDTLTLAAGTNISLSANTSTDTITIATNADENVIEEIQLGGNALTVDNNRAVNLEVASNNDIDAITNTEGSNYTIPFWDYLQPSVAVNLLHNADWGYSLINQRNFSGYSGSSVMCIDRWKIEGNGTVTPSNDYLTLGPSTVIKQIIPFSNLNMLRLRPMTFAYQTLSGNIQSCHIRFPYDLPERMQQYNHTTVQDLEIHCGFVNQNFKINNTTYSTVPFIRICNYTQSDVSVRRVWFEFGSVCHMDNTPPLDYAVNLMICQHYYTPSGAARHNCTYRGKNLGSSVTNDQWEAISSGTFDDMYIGDYWVINNKTWRIAAFNYWMNTGDIRCTTPHIVIMPDENIVQGGQNTHCLSSTDNTVGGDDPGTIGGYLGTDFYRGTNGNTGKATCLQAAQMAFDGSTSAGTATHILMHREFLKNRVMSGDNACESGGEWYYSNIELPNEPMVYGSYMFANKRASGVTPAYYTNSAQQLPMFTYNRALIAPDSNAPWWLRDVCSATSFCCVSHQGFCTQAPTSSAWWGIRPVFGICAQNLENLNML